MPTDTAPSVPTPARPTMVLTLVVRAREDGTEVLLGEKKRGFGQGKMIGPGGHIEPGETPSDAAARETWEETSLSIDPETLVPAALLEFGFPYRPEWSTVVGVFRAEVWSGTPSESDELDPTWYPVAALPLSQMWDDDAYWLQRVLVGEATWGRFEYGADNATVEWAELMPLPAGALGEFPRVLR